MTAARSLEGQRQEFARRRMVAMPLAGVAMSLAAYAIAIPFYLVQPDSLPLTVGILTGLMWLPLSRIMRHRVGWLHTGVRTVGVLAAWLVFAEARFEAMAAVIVAVYVVTLVILERRWRREQGTKIPARCLQQPDGEADGSSGAVQQRPTASACSELALST